jgi:fibronectin type 3 domain-containing protein
MVSILLKPMLALLLLVGLNAFAEGTIVYLPSDAGPSKGPFDIPVLQIPDLDAVQVGVPATPTHLQASASECGKIKLTWDSMNFATSYKVWRRVLLAPFGTPYAQIGTSDTNHYEDSSVNITTRYLYKVQACNVFGTCSDLSATDTAQPTACLIPFPVLTKPDTPSSINATDGSFTNKIVISWSNESADYYEVWRTHGGGAAVKIAGHVATTSYSDTGLAEGVAYSYQVKACNGVGCSALSGADAGSTAAAAPAVTTPSAPTVVQATDGTHADKVVITYNASADVAHVAYYRIFRETSLFGIYDDSIGTSTTTTFTDTTATPGTQYYYAVTACNAAHSCAHEVHPDGGYAGTLGSSDPVSDPVAVPAVPANVVASDGTYTDKVQVVISTVADATSYEVYRSSDAVAVGNKIGTVSTHITFDTTAVAGAQYYYRAKACNSAGCSDYTMPDQGYVAVAEVMNIEETVASALVAGGSYTSNGTFGQHDFANAVGAFDWAFTTSSGTSYQLQGNPPTPTDVFGWKRADIPTPTPIWYMFPMGSDVDGDGTQKFDWILVYTDTNDKQVYKLNGVSGTGNFLYSNKIDVDYTISGNTITFTAP